MDKSCQVTQTLSFDSILRAETQDVKTRVQGQGGRLRSKLSLIRNIQTGAEVGELVRYWARSLDDEGDISSYDDAEDIFVENNEESCCMHHQQFDHCSTPSQHALSMDCDVCSYRILQLLPGSGGGDALHHLGLPGQGHHQDAQHVPQPTNYQIVSLNIIFDTSLSAMRALVYPLQRRINFLLLRLL